MTSCKYAKDVAEGDQIMLRSYPVLVRRVWGPAHLGRSEYFVTGNDIIDGREYGQAFHPDDVLALVHVNYTDKRVEEASVETLVITFADGTKAFAWNQALAQDIWSMLSYHKMSRITSGVMATIVSAAGRTVVVES
ncbi:hypothetical protein E2P81_ATG05796 [Venturia nashicola]|nr:hypothetical protein E2P81_ATG05796 [Venturia nashicola]